jgi:ribonucleoside-triphosphate reductase
MLDCIRKRDWKTEPFQPAKIACAIYKAAVACGGNDFTLAERLAQKVVQRVNRMFSDSTPTVEQVQDLVEKVLIENGHARTAKAYIDFGDNENVHRLPRRTCQADERERQYSEEC